MQALYSAATLQSFVVAFRQLARLTREAEGRGVPLALHLCERGAACRAAWTRGVTALQSAATGLERAVRTLAWALDAGEPARADVRVVDAGTRDAWDGRIATGDEPAGLRIPTVAWLDEAPVPRGLAERAARGHLVLIADAATAGLEPGPYVVLATNAAVIRRPGPDGEARFRLSPAAGLLQALLAGPPTTTWPEVRPPAGFEALERDLDLDDAFAEVQAGRAPLLRARREDGAIVVPARSLPKTPAHPR